MPSSADNSLNSLRSSPRPMIGYGNVETRIIEAEYPAASSLASITSNEEAGHLYLSGHASNEQSREELSIPEICIETKNERYACFCVYKIRRRICKQNSKNTEFSMLSGYWYEKFFYPP